MKFVFPQFLFSQSMFLFLKFPQFNATTCSWDAYHRGPNQKVASFSFYRNPNTEEHKSRKYLEGVKANLELLKQLYSDKWTMRLYFDLNSDDQELYYHQFQLCHLMQPHTDTVKI